MEQITFIDWFAGVGGFRRGMELAGHKCVGFCEFDKYATMSYTAMHLCTDEQLNTLAEMPLKDRQKEILKDEYRNGEWYADDIRTVDARSIPKADVWCFGFPCQDISIAGKQLGFTGNRSSLFFRVMYLLGQLEEEKKPGWLFIENVKNLLSVNGGWDFARLLTALDEGGYDAEWEILNSKDHGVPQNRERVFIIGHLRGRGGREVFPLRLHDAEAAELQGLEGRNRVITGTLDTRIEGDTRGTYPVLSGGGTALKVSGYHKR
jgi:DNA (cytosine-5)-methyltransferase 1